MNRFAFAAALAALGSLCALPAQAVELTASVDSNCHPVTNQFVVPAGKAAKNFALSSVKPGKDCILAGQDDPPQFEIQTSAGLPAYAYISHSGTTWETFNSVRPIPHTGSEAMELKTLQLTPGTYYLAIDSRGGRGATVTVTYDIVP